MRPSHPARSFRVLVAASTLAAFAVTGCANFDPFAPPPSSPPPMSEEDANREYRIGVPDLLELTVWQHEDVSGPLLVRSDGKVSVPLMGDVRAEGRTPTELAAVIRNGLRDYIAKPRVDIAVTEMNSQVVSVIGGGIEREGQVELQRNTRVIEAIAAMGGLTPFAKKRRIRVLRNTPEGQVEYNFDYNAFVNGEAPDSNLVLEAGDTIIVPD
ncbi:MAG: polysaccharide export protein [bacterium]|nr:polysaccharide export protein [bacterium]